MLSQLKNLVVWKFRLQLQVTVPSLHFSDSVACHLFWPNWYFISVWAWLPGFWPIAPAESVYSLFKGNMHQPLFGTF